MSITSSRIGVILCLAHVQFGSDQLQKMKKDVKQLGEVRIVDLIFTDKTLP